MAYIRKRRSLQLPITLSIALLMLNVTMMVCWIVILVGARDWGAMTVGTVAFSLMIIGITMYLVLTIKEVNLNRRQANFVDSVTHELKSPIAALKLYLETLKMRQLDENKRGHFYEVMEDELDRLDRLISQLLEVGRLDAIGQETELENVGLDKLIRESAAAAAAHHKVEAEAVFSLSLAPVTIRARRLVLEMIFRNLLDNAIKYGGDPPKVEVDLRKTERGRVVVRVSDHGEGVPVEFRKKIFRIFYRGGDELERKRKGTGLGLYIVRTLVSTLKGKVGVHSRLGEQGTVFEVELPASVVA